MFRKLHINIPFAEALAQMPTYVKFMKDILSNKRKLEEFETVALTEECSAILQNKLPPKLKDPGKFTIPCTIGNLEFGQALLDSGASINLMPFSIFKKLGLGKVKPTRVTLQLADRSIKHPYGIIEDVLMKVGKFFFPVDFVILEMEEDVEIPLILGRPFLKTSGALIDHKEDKLSLRIEDEKVEFNMFKATESPSLSECLRVEVVDPPVGDFFGRDIPKELPKSTFEHGSTRKKIKESHKIGSHGVVNKIQATSPIKDERKMEKREKRKSTCAVEETKKVNGLWVRTFYASYKLKRKGVFDEPKSMAFLEDPT